MLHPSIRFLVLFGAVVSTQLFALQQLRAQSFTAVTTGDIIEDSGSSGAAAWGDFDDDGYPDVVIPHTDGQYTLLLKNNKDGTFTTITEGPVVNILMISQGMSFGDYDNDGDLDLYLAEVGGGNSYFFVNQGNGTFERITSGTIVENTEDVRSVAWGDYDNDGFLDLLAVKRFGADNVLFHNSGDGTFNRVMQGPIVADGSDSNVGIWGDIDNDGDLDLFLANRGINALYLNTGKGTFTQVFDDPVVGSGETSVSASFGDYDNDGFLDLFVGQNESFNRLYRNDREGGFIEITDSPIDDEVGMVNSSSWVDYDNDGDLDLYVGNGFDLDNLLYRNEGNGTFTQVTDELITQDGTYSEGTAWADYDRDGDLDLLIANFRGRNAFYINDGNENHWINIKLEGQVSNRSAIGARVRLLAFVQGEYRWQTREISGQTGKGSQNELNATFGLGEATTIDSLEVRWPSGLVEVFTDIAADQFLTIIEGPVIRVNDPNGEETWTRGSNQTVTWRDNIEGHVRIELIDGGSTVRVLSEGTESDGAFIWTVPADLAEVATYRIRVSSIDDPTVQDESDHLFSVGGSVIQTPFLSLSRPTGGEYFELGSPQRILWLDNLTGDVKIVLHRDGVVLSVLAAQTDSDGEYYWTVPADQPVDDTYQISVLSIDDPALHVTSGSFSIVEVAPPFITVRTPGGGEIWEVGTEQIITWEDNIEGPVQLELMKGGRSYQLLDYLVESDGSYTWTVSGYLFEGSDYRIRIISLDDPSIYASSNGTFSISNPLNVSNEEVPDGEAPEITFALLPNYPNPFNPSTNIVFDLPQPAEVDVMVYDVLGRGVATFYAGVYPQGRNLVFSVDASSWPSGTYFYRLLATGGNGAVYAGSGSMRLVK